MTGVDTDNTQDSLTADQLAVLADPLHGGSYLHGVPFFSSPLPRDVKGVQSSKFAGVKVA